MNILFEIRIEFRPYIIYPLYSLIYHAFVHLKHFRLCSTLMSRADCLPGDKLTICLFPHSQQFPPILRHAARFIAPVLKAIRSAFPPNSFPGQVAPDVTSSTNENIIKQYRNKINS